MHLKPLALGPPQALRGWQETTECGTWKHLSVEASCKNIYKETT